MESFVKIIQLDRDCENPMKLRVSLLASLCLLTSAMAGAADAPIADAGALYSSISDAYMEGKFVEIEGALARAGKRMKDFTAEQQADILYVRKALAECRPKWWNACKSGKKTLIRQPILGKSVRAVFDPAGKEGMQFKSGSGGISVTISWDHKSMDSGEGGTYGSPKGDIICGGIWSNLAVAQVWSSMSLKAISKMSVREKLRFNRYLGYRANLAALYYGTPAARRYFMHIYTASFYYDNWGKSEIAGARRIVCAMVISELLKDPSRYPSMKLPNQLDAVNAEEGIAKHYHGFFNRKTVWTITEDKQLRESIKAFAAANGNVYKTEKATLPNKLIFAMDIKVDDTIRAKRDAWIKEQFDKAKSSGQGDR